MHTFANEELRAHECLPCHFEEVQKLSGTFADWRYQNESLYMQINFSKNSKLICINPEIPIDKLCKSDWSDFVNQSILISNKETINDCFIDSNGADY